MKFPGPLPHYLKLVILAYIHSTTHTTKGENQEKMYIWPLTTPRREQEEKKGDQNTSLEFGVQTSDALQIVSPTTFATLKKRNGNHRNSLEDQSLVPLRKTCPRFHFSPLLCGGQKLVADCRPMPNTCWYISHHTRRAKTKEKGKREKDPNLCPPSQKSELKGQPQTKNCHSPYFPAKQRNRK